MKSFYCCIALLCCFIDINAQVVPAYKNKALPIQTRVDSLLKIMTAEEKFRQLFMVAGDLGNNPEQFKEGLFGFQINTETQNAAAANQMMSYNPGLNASETANKINSIQKYFIENTRLGIPIIAFDEALHGLVRSGATSFPQSIGLAATFDTTLMNKVGLAIAAETKARGIRQILSPVINIATDVRWGRVEETYGEDPYLASLMGVAYIKSLEQSGVIATPKHFAVNHGEGGRDSYPVNINERQLEESYFVPFKAAVQKAGARSIMTAYNSLDGRPCSANDYLLNKKLKNEWGFGGFVISDAGATGGANVLHFTTDTYEESGKQSIENGLDVIFQTGFDSYGLFKTPFLTGQVNAAKVDSAVARVLKAKFELGLFDSPYVEAPNKDYEKTLIEHREIAKQAALKSFVLLKNANSVLPLQNKYKNIAVIGTDAVEARQGGYCGPGNNPVAILTGMKNEFGKAINIKYVPGPGRIYEEVVPVSANRFYNSKDAKKQSSGLKASYYNNIDLSGAPVVERNENSLNFQWTLFSPDPKINYDFFSAEFEGYIESPKKGKYKIGVKGNEGYKLYLNDSLVLDTWTGQSFSAKIVDFDFKSDFTKFKLIYKESSGNSKLALVWNCDNPDSSEIKINEAVKLAKESDAIVYVAGIEEGEFRDRSDLKLPGKQEETLLALSKLGKPLTVLIVGGSAVNMTNWIDKVDAILDVWYPGEAGGEAVAKVLKGEVSPSGKLPITFPMNEGQLPLTYNHKPTGRGDDYLNGTGHALFPFGFGLSYSTFEYNNVKLEKPAIKIGEGSRISFTIKNTGKFDADEVAQLYIYDELASVVRPIKELKSFQRISLKSGEAKTLAFDITPEMLTMLDLNLKPTIEPGFFRIMIGSSSKDIRLRERLEVRK